MSINYTLHFDNRLSIAFKGRACFSFLGEFKQGLKHTYGIEYLDGNGEVINELTSIEYFIRMEQKTSSHYFIDYLYKKYHKWIEESSAHEIYETKTVSISSDCPTNLALIILNFFRFMDEFPYKVDNFYKLKGLKNQDLAFLIACGVNNNEEYDHYNNHNVISDMSIDKIHEFVTLEHTGMGPSLKEDPEYTGLTVAFSGEGKGVLKDIIERGGCDLSTMYSELEERYEEHCGVMAAELQKTLPKGGGESGDNIHFEGADWKAVFFAP